LCWKVICFFFIICFIQNIFWRFLLFIFQKIQNLKIYYLRRKMKLIFTLVLSILAIDKLTTINIKISDICIRAQNRCKGFYEYGLKYKTKCEKIACQGKLNFECGLDYCAQNKPVFKFHKRNNILFCGWVLSSASWYLHQRWWLLFSN